MPTYTITIKNNSSQSQSFVLFQDLPKPANIPRDNVFTNVYQRAARVSNSAEARFQISSDLYALHGASHRTDDGMVQVETSEYRPARLGPQGSRFYLTTENSRGQFPRFGKEDDSVQAGGAFAISSDGTFDFRNPEHMYFGVGAIAPDTGYVVPVQTYPVKPNEVVQVYSKPKYYVAFGNFEPGTIIDPMMLGNVLSVDFYGSDGHEATFTLDDRNDYVPDDDVRSSGIHWIVGQQS